MPLSKTLKFILGHPVTRGHRARSLLHFLKWQIGSRLVPGPVVYSWIEPSKLIVRRGATGVTGNVYCGLHDFSDMGYLLHVVSPDDLFIDVGANLGSYTVLACKARGARGCCFEPVPGTFDRLMENLRINDLTSRVQAFNLGLSDSDGELLFTSGEDTTNHVVGDSEVACADSVCVPVTTLDRALENYAPSVIKIDVEGYEAPVLKGAQNLLDRDSLHSVIIELNGSGSRYGHEDDDILNAMRAHGFSTFSYDPVARELTPLDGKKNPSGNTLFVRDVDAILKKIKSATKIRVGDMWL